MQHMEEGDHVQGTNRTALRATEVRLAHPPVLHPGPQCLANTGSTDMFLQGVGRLRQLKEASEVFPGPVDKNLMENIHAERSPVESAVLEGESEVRVLGLELRYVNWDPYSSARGRYSTPSK